MINKKRLNTLLVYLFIYLGIGLFIIYKFPFNSSNENQLNYSMIAFSYFVVSGLLISTFAIRTVSIFEPLLITTIIYLMLFSITPLINIINNDNLWFGVDVMEGCIKATSIYIISYVFLWIGYNCNIKLKRNINKKIKKIYEYEDKKRILNIAIIIWGACFLLSICYFLLSGMNLTYIFTLGGAGEISNNGGSAIEFISMFSYSLIPTFMYIYIYGKNKLFKSVLFLLSLLVYLLRGFRFIIVILVIAPIVYKYIKSNTKPKANKIVLLGIVMILGIGVIGFIRDAIRFDGNISWSNLSIDFIVNAIKENFDIYKTFYGGVVAIPTLHNYTMGSQILYTFTMFIPKIIWSNKPMPQVQELIALSINEVGSKSGTAWPNLGEFYTEFGVLGCIILMFIFGVLLSKSKKLTYDLNNDHKLIAYSIILPSILQLVIRGYTPSNFYLMVFLIMPIIFIKNFAKTKIV